MPTHNYDPIRSIIGRRRDGRPIYQIAGGDGNDTQNRDYLDRLNTEWDTHTDAIDEVVNRALAENRDLTDDENGECERHQEAADKLLPQIKRWRKLREARADAVVQREQAPAPVQRVQVRERPGGHNADDDQGADADGRVQRSAGDYVMDLFRANRGNVEARERITRALTKVTTADTPGLLPQTYTGDVLGKIKGPRPLVERAATRINLPASGMSLRRPKITDHVNVDKQTAEKTQVATGAFKVAFDESPLDTFAGAVNMSIQEMERTDPSAVQLIFEDFAAKYGKRTEQQTAQVLVDAVEQSVELPADGPKEQVLAAVYGAAGLVVAGTDGEMPDVIAASLDQWGRLGALTMPINPQDGISSSTPRSLVQAVAGLDVVVSAQLPAGTLLLGNKAYLEVAETPNAPVQLRALEVGILGYEIGVYGLFNAAVTNPLAWTKLAPAAAPAG